MLGFNIGVDLLHVPRMRALLQRQGSPARLANRILTVAEAKTFAERFAGYHHRGEHLPEDIVRYLGVRWAAKEAAFKASIPHFIYTNQNNKNGSKNEEISKHEYLRPTWKDFEILYKVWSQPYISILRSGEPFSEGKLSISHDGEYIIATAVIPEH